MQITELIEVFIDHHPDIKEDELTELANADPTTIQNERGVFCGKYAVWIANQYVKGNIKAGDAPELKAALTTYDKNKSQLKPIKEVMDLNELIDLVKGLSDDFKPARCISKGEQGLEKVYEDEEWIVYIPHTFEASRKIGGDTRWCTASSKGRSTFEYYSNKGPLYVNIRKSDGEKFQFHFETGQFMDKEDMSIKLKGFGFNDGIIEFYQNICCIFNSYLKYDKVEIADKERFYKVSLNGKFNFISKTDGNLLFPEQWFDACNRFFHGYAVVSLNQKYNWINTFGQFISSQWFEKAYDFCGNNAIILQNGKETWVNNKGELLLPNHWFDNVQYFRDGIAEVCLNDKWNFINLKGELLSPNQWFEGVTSYFKTRGYGVIRVNGKYNRIDKNGNIIFDVWLDDDTIIEDCNYGANSLCVGLIDGDLVAIKNRNYYKISELIDNYENR